MKTREQIEKCESLAALMVGETFERVSVAGDNDKLVFATSDGFEVEFYHNQNCCESVSIEDISGDLTDLVGSPIMVAEERSNCSETECASETWTFYTFRTMKGTVDVRWHGKSNGYYSERVDVRCRLPGFSDNEDQFIEDRVDDHVYPNF